MDVRSSLRKRRTTRELQDSLEVEDVETVVKRGRLGWFRHVERKVREDWVSSCRELVVEGIKAKGRARKTWRQFVENDMTLLKLNKSDAQNRILWKNSIKSDAQNRILSTNSICGKRLTSVRAEKGGKTDDDNDNDDDTRYNRETRGEMLNKHSIRMEVTRFD
jgi:hypothetical protein